MPLDGLEKRRPGPVNQLRRALYALLMGSATLPTLVAADGSLPAAHRRLPLVQTSAPMRLDGNVLLARDPFAPGGALLAYGGLEPLLSHAAGLGPDFAFVPVGDLLLTAHFLGTDLSKIDKGLGVDLAIPELGYFHLNLFTGRDGPAAGKRWQINPQGFELPQSTDRLWSLGGSLAVERDQPGGHRHLLFVPQLVLNLGAITHASGRLEALVSYHNWLGLPHQPQTVAGRVPQLSLRWSF
jgi:hypothetical protein